MDEPDKEIVALFIDEVGENIQALNEGLLLLEGNLELAKSDPEQVHILFRAFHSVKGASGMMGFNRINQLTHKSETLLDLVRDGKKQLTPQIVSRLLQAVGGLTTLVEELQSGENKLDLEPIFKELDVLIEQKDDALESKILVDVSPIKPAKKEISPEIQKYVGPFLADTSEKIAEWESLILQYDQNRNALAPGAIVELIDGMFRCAHNIKGNAGAIGFESIQDLAHHAENALTWLKDHADKATSESFNLFLECLDRFKLALNQIRDGENSEVNISDLIPKIKNICQEKLAKPVEPSASRKSKGENNSTDTSVAKGSAGPVSETMRVDIERLDKLMNLAGELVLNKAHFQQLDSSFKEWLGDNGGLSSRIQSLCQQIHLLQKTDELAQSTFLSERIRQISEGSEYLMEHVDNVHKARQIYSHYENAMHQLDLTTRDLQRSVMNMRMVPVGPLFARFKRVVRDIAQECGKEIRLVLKGESTEIDKRMADDLVDPLTHMVRNAADHGLETGDDREKNNKPREGTVILNAYHQGGAVCITITDDGRGINPEIIKNKAIEKGIITPEEAAKLSNKEIVEFIFHPGFSTAGKVTSISGRGVGMDIVKKKIEHLKGSVEIESTPGKGTQFIISLPLTLAIQKSLLCQIRGISFALPLESVMEIVQVKNFELKTVRGHEVIRLRQHVVPIQTIGEIFQNTKFASQLKPDDNHHQNDGLQEVILVILKHKDAIVGLRVDKLFGQQEIVIKSLSRNFGNIRGVSGVSILGNGRVSLILDVAGIFDLFSKRNFDQTNEESRTSEPVTTEAGA